MNVAQQHLPRLEELLQPYITHLIGLHEDAELRLYLCRSRRVSSRARRKSRRLGDRKARDGTEVPRAHELNGLGVATSW